MESSPNSLLHAADSEFITLATVADRELSGNEADLHDVRVNELLNDADDSGERSTAFRRLKRRWFVHPRRQARRPPMGGENDVEIYEEQGGSRLAFEQK